METTFASISATVGILISLLLAYIPPLEKWYVPLIPKQKVLITVAANALACIVIFLLSCYVPSIPEQLGVVFPCSTNAFFEIVKMLGIALMANQTTYMLAVRKFR